MKKCGKEGLSSMGKLIGELDWRLWMCEVEEFTDTAVLSIHSI